MRSLAVIAAALQAGLMNAGVPVDLARTVEPSIDPSKSSPPLAMHREWVDRSKQRPHQGAREKARRAKRQQARTKSHRWARIILEAIDVKGLST
jgi:hypothetical protein